MLCSSVTWAQQAILTQQEETVTALDAAYKSWKEAFLEGQKILEERADAFRNKPVGYQRNLALIAKIEDSP